MYIYTGGGGGVLCGPILNRWVTVVGMFSPHMSWLNVCLCHSFAFGIYLYYIYPMFCIYGVIKFTDKESRILNLESWLKFGVWCESSFILY